jgi:phosphatidate cytidylyltransferase
MNEPGRVGSADAMKRLDGESPLQTRKPGGFADLGPRVISAVVLVALAIAALIAGGDWFVLFWMAACLAINWEWQGLVGGERRSARVALGGVGLAVSAALAHGGAIAPGLAVLGAAAAAAAALAGPGKRLWAAGGVIYAGSLLVSVCLLRDSPRAGLLSIAWLFAVVWGTDVFAYFGGRLIGGPKLWPRVSAGKTWSGTLTGAFAGALLGLAVARLADPASVNSLAVFVVSFVASGVSQLGDLAESAIKRHFGVKDSSRLIPGHGGVMDRLDGFIFACVFAALLGAAHGLESTAAGVFFW